MIRTFTPIRRPPRLLLDRKIPNKTRMPAVLFESGDLFRRRNEPVTGHTVMLPKGLAMRSNVGRRYLPGLKAGVSTARSR
ncbi:hypothetical protein FRACA_1040001 [Frankia canadensis]|uniref:Uncharacterized protein n=1 Tax=Frankia canadensis TaxID=1836972 RepID=A0A2I2KIW1_9ACTN|nr:hypothetical protein FRACA_1040001 [Frankia canadensis]SOU52886.1 hypothetical protein FRACA_1040001 [Frankia canadensis]